MINGNNEAFGGRVMQINIDSFNKKETKSYFEERLPEYTFTKYGFERFYKCTKGILVYINSFVKVLSKDVIYNDEKIKETFLNGSNIDILALNIGYIK